VSFKNAKIVAVNANPVAYHNTEIPRGDARFQMSSSGIRAFAVNPSKWREPIVDEEGKISYFEHAGSKSTEWGNLFDTLLLTPQQFDARYAVSPAKYETEVLVCPSCASISTAKKCKECNTFRVVEKVLKDWSPTTTHCKEWKAEKEKEGLECVKASDIFKIKQAIARFNRDPILPRFVEASQKQVWIVAEWHDEETGLVIPCKCLIDLVLKVGTEFEKCVGDVKTARTAQIGAWESWCLSAGYEIQAAWNTDMLVAATNREIITFCFLLSENTAPYEPGRRIMSQDIADPSQDMGAIASGRRQYRKMMAYYCKCLKTGTWPGYDDHADAAQGWTLVTPNPYKEMARDAAPKPVFEGEEPDPDAEPEADDFDTPP